MEKLYKVSMSSENIRFIYAKTNDQAKRIYCKENGTSPSDYWCGISSLKACALKANEVKEYEEKTAREHQTCKYIKGMLDIFAKVHIKQEEMR